MVKGGRWRNPPHDRWCPIADSPKKGNIIGAPCRVVEDADPYERTAPKQNPQGRFKNRPPAPAVTRQGRLLCTPAPRRIRTFSPSCHCEPVTDVTGVAIRSPAFPSQRDCHSRANPHRTPRRGGYHPPACGNPLDVQAGRTRFSHGFANASRVHAREASFSFVTRSARP